MTGWCKRLDSGQCEERADGTVCMHTDAGHAHPLTPLPTVWRAVPGRLWAATVAFWRPLRPTFLHASCPS
eukprot:CAMPEP_0174708330 /NCGR_PEP_ID=MMETSP1094-20130205/10620_1 /TAXON_ID=156173 /ORGANISM="Chrysochromulina brevifilum, Strain UTEX LB 985" /LENGTH=69 /DNA_ID=CAMNT_0015906873 /DNA_START=101 /DNA_END=306 /DNA_ORIENTATION=-